MHNVVIDHHYVVIDMLSDMTGQVIIRTAGPIGGGMGPGPPH